MIRVGSSLSAAPPHVVFRADASRSIGTGHVVRCETLATELAGRGWSITFAARELPEALATRLRQVGSVVRFSAFEDDAAALLARFSVPGRPSVAACVTDSYAIGREWQQAARTWARRIIAIDDLAVAVQGADLLLNQNLGVSAGAYRELVRSGARVLIGPRYALVRPQFAAARRAAKKRTGKVDHVFVFASGADAPDVTRRAAEACAAVGLAADVVIGAAYPHGRELRTWANGQSGIAVHENVEDMASLMARADVAIGAPSSASWERCVVGLPTLLVTLADNQLGVEAELERLGAARALGWHHQVGVEAISAALRDLRDDPSAVREMARAAARIADGKGTLRVVREIERLVTR